MLEKDNFMQSLKMPKYLEIADAILKPLMFILGGCTKDSLQETHGRHCLNIDPKKIDPSLCLNIQGDGDTRVKEFWNGIHHMTILGGWKNYIIIENNQINDYRFIGRKGKDFCQIHRLPIYDKQIKVLKGPKGIETQFFAFNKDGTQSKLTVIDHGTIGDMKYPQVRLF